MRTLIFEPVLTGHHLEYLHHLYIGAISHPDVDYIFAVPKNEWSAMRDKRNWPAAENIEWFMLNSLECNIVRQGSMIRQSWSLSKLIQRTARNVHANRVFLVVFSLSIPVLPFIIPKNVTISGIIYKIYLRARLGSMRKFIERIRYFIMARCKKVESVFILNDSRSALELNKIYSTDKFIPLSDPVPDVKEENLIDLRHKLGIDSDAKIFLHFGAMDSRKGTLLILNALDLISPAELSNMVFVFAGKVGDSIKEKFYSQVEKARKHGANIIVQDEFCEYDYLNNLCHTADCILIPYLLTDLSSGAIGYAAVHRTPVIGPASGLIGDLIRDNNLGVVLEEITAETLAEAIVNYEPIKINTDYAVRNSIDAFYSTIFD